MKYSLLCVILLTMHFSFDEEARGIPWDSWKGVSLCTLTIYRSNMYTIRWAKAFQETSCTSFIQEVKSKKVAVFIHRQGQEYHAPLRKGWWCLEKRGGGAILRIIVLYKAKRDCQKCIYSDFRVICNVSQLCAVFSRLLASVIFFTNITRFYYLFF